VYQLTQPNKYNKEYAKSQVSMLFVPYSGGAYYLVPARKQGFEFKTFYKMEVNWGFSSKKVSGSLHTSSACSNCALTRRAAGGHSGPGRRQIPHVRLRPPGVLQPGHDPVHRYKHCGSHAATPLYATNRFIGVIVVQMRTSCFSARRRPTASPTNARTSSARWRPSTAGAWRRCASCGYPTPGCE
jgi:hypothetical protein